jgi:hypothetical protein
MTMQQHGYIAIVSVLTIGMISLAVATSVIFLGVDFSRASLAIEKSNEVKAVSNACAEEALQQIRNATSFSGSGNLNLGSGNCSYTVTNLGENNRQINVVGTVDDTIRKVQIEIDAINPKINIVSWQEVADFY